MASSTIPWGTGTGNIYLTYTGTGNGSISVTSDPNPLPITRVQTLVVRCPDYPFPSVVLNVWQAPGSKVLQASFNGSFDDSFENGAEINGIIHTYNDVYITRDNDTAITY